jgi:hypothetical protein
VEGRRKIYAMKAKIKELGETRWTSKHDKQVSSSDRTRSEKKFTNHWMNFTSERYIQSWKWWKEHTKKRSGENANGKMSDPDQKSFENKSKVRTTIWTRRQQEGRKGRVSMTDQQRAG